MYKGKYYLREVSVIRGSCRNCDVKNLSKVGNKLHGRCKRSKILIEVIFPDGTTFDEYNLTATCPNTGEVFQIKKITEVDERHRFWRWERRRVYIIDGGVYTMETMVPMGTPCQGCSFLIGDDCKFEDDQAFPRHRCRKNLEKVCRPAVVLSQTSIRNEYGDEFFIKKVLDGIEGNGFEALNPFIKP